MATNSELEHAIDSLMLCARTTGLALGLDPAGGDGPVTSIAAQLRAARGTHTQQAVADAAGIDRPRLAEYENGREPKSSTLAKIAAAIDTLNGGGEVVFTVGGSTDVGEPRAERLSDKRERAARKRR